MADDKKVKEKRIRTWYWIVTCLLLFGMVTGGIVQILKAKFNADGFVHLGYPLYAMQFIGVWKLLGAIALLLPGYKLLKEWAYAGFFFVLTGAVISHVVSGDDVVKWIAPFVFVVLTVLSWYLRPANRRIVYANRK